MSLKIGEIYRYSNQKVDGVPACVVDGLPNFFYETYAGKDYSTVTFQRGIHNVAVVKLRDGGSRIPCIIISSSPHKAGTDMTPWEDDFDPDYGHVRYFGDNKTHEKLAHEATGNRLLLECYSTYDSPDRNERVHKGVPLIFLKRVSHDGRVKGNLMFQGFGIIEDVHLITQFDPKLSIQYFSNYAFDMCVFTMKDEGEVFNWDWINARRNPEMSDEDTLKYAPKAWRKWVKEGSTSLYKVRRTVSVRKIISEQEQRPELGSKEGKILNTVYEYYSKGKQHIFELLAMRVTQEIFKQSGMDFTSGWVTEKSGDKGIDFVGRLNVSSNMSSLRVVVLGQAKCEKLSRPTNGVHIARTVARLKRGWFGVYVTTSYYSKNVQLEVMDDQYPIMMICGRKLAETISHILFAGGMTLEEFLCSLEEEYHTTRRRPEDIIFG